MNVRRGITALLLTAACAVSAHAEPLSGPAARLDAQLEAMIERGDLFAGVVTEQDVGLLFAHLRAALLAAAAGREPPKSDALDRRAEEIGRELKARGMLGGILLLDMLEARARQWAREAPPAREAPSRQSVQPARPNTRL